MEHMLSRHEAGFNPQHQVNNKNKKCSMANSYCISLRVYKICIPCPVEECRKHFNKKYKVARYLKIHSTMRAKCCDTNIEK